MLVVPGRPSTNGLTWWARSATGAAPKIELQGPGADGARVVSHALRRPDMPAHAGVPVVVATTGLRPDTEYALTAQGGGADADTARSRTLPDHLTPLTPFTLSVGSCYCPATDNGIAHWSRMHAFGSDDPIRLRILCGDQIYMDLGPNSGGPISNPAPDPWRRYPQLWESPAYRPFLTASPNLMVADDHEFWNDYPHSNAWLLWDENRPGGPRGTMMDRAFSVFQAALNLDPAAVTDAAAPMDQLLADQARTFSFDLGPLNLFVLDSRTRRTKYNTAAPHFAMAAWLDRAEQWAGTRTTPGILAISAPLARGRMSWFQRNVSHKVIGGDANLPDYEDDFARLWNALFQAPHDTLIVTGDIHWSRLYHVTPGSGGGRSVYEFVSSPLSRIPSGSPDAGRASGKVEWGGPAAKATWVRRLARTDRQLYGTLTFIPLGAPGAPVRVRAQLWGLPPDPNAAAARLAIDEFTLT